MMSVGQRLHMPSVTIGAVKEPIIALQTRAEVVICHIIGTVKEPSLPCRLGPKLYDTFAGGTVGICSWAGSTALSLYKRV